MQTSDSFRTLDEWLPWLERLSPREIVLGLERVSAVLDKLAFVNAPLTIVVGGTNGKGSSAAMLEALLLADGHTTGCYTSPHLQRFNERFRVCADPVSDADIMQALARVESAREDIPLTFFEFGTLAGLLLFAAKNVDVMILEVGMGGRLDAVNAIDSDACLITNVALDHCAWLGDDVESIAAEKAGILRSGKPAVFGGETLPDAIRQRAVEIDAELRVAGTDFAFENAADGTWRWRGRNHDLSGLPAPGNGNPVQVRNAAAVLALLEALEFDSLLQSERINEVLASLAIPGRFQRVAGEPEWLLDVAHNAESAQALSASLARLEGAGVAYGIIGQLQDKDTAAIAQAISAQVGAWIAVGIPGKRGLPATIAARDVANATGRPCMICPDIAGAMQFAETNAGPGERVLVTGSFQVVGPALTWLQDDATAAI